MLVFTFIAASRVVYDLVDNFIASGAVSGRYAKYFIVRNTVYLPGPGFLPLPTGFGQLNAFIYAYVFIISWG